MERILCIYPYGSYVYGTNDEQSDIDYIFVTEHQRKKEEQMFAGRWSITAYPADYFQELLDRHDVSSLECFFLPPHKKIEFRKFDFTLDLEKLRRSFSAKASNSWVKAKKKIDIHGEFRIGRKSLFHALRILDFGIQIAEEGRIVEYLDTNGYWDKIVKQDFTCWEDYKQYWQPIYNSLHSRFKLCAPFNE